MSTVAVATEVISQHLAQFLNLLRLEADRVSYGHERSPVIRCGRSNHGELQHIELSRLSYGILQKAITLALDVLPKIAQQFGVSRVVVQNKTFLSVHTLNSMLEEPLASNTSEENYLVTTVISHVVKPGREPGYEAWFHGIAADARKFKGHLGVSTIRPQHHAHPEYVVILKFDCYDNLKAWLESDVRREWIERLQPLIEKPEDIQTLTGLETWFTLPNKSMKAPPPRYKMALVTWLGVFVTISILNRLLVPLLSWLPALLTSLTITGLTVMLLTYLIMPRLTPLFRKWLYPIP